MDKFDLDMPGALDGLVTKRSASSLVLDRPRLDHPMPPDIETRPDAANPNWVLAGDPKLSPQFLLIVCLKCRFFCLSEKSSTT